MVERSPEKAGVGGSIPSLATIFSSTCPLLIFGFGCNWLHNFGLIEQPGLLVAA